MMSVHVGIGLAFVAMLCWGFGDFFIQKSTRKLGDWESLFIITIIGVIVTLPFVWRQLPGVATSFLTIDGWASAGMILVIACVVLFVSGILDFEALRAGKLSVIEPIWSTEVPVAALLAFIFLGEHITTLQLILIIALVVGLILVSFKGYAHAKQFFLEKGVVIGLVGAILMGGANFLTGWSSRLFDPLTVNFVTDLFIACVTAVYLLSHGKFMQVFTDLRKYPKLIVSMSLADKAAWIAFMFAMSLAPIAVAVALSESYIIITVLLGIFVNHEKIQRHQKFGLIIAVFGAIFLASIT